MSKALWLLSGCWAVIAVPVLAEEIAVANASFEDYSLSAGEATENGAGLTGWTFDPGLDVGVWNISNRVDFPAGAPDGVNVAYSYGFGIQQVLSSTLLPGGVYRLTAAVGASPHFVFPGYRLQLWAGNTLLAEDNSSLTIALGTHETSVVSYASPFGDANAGADIEIRLLALGPEVTFDSVKMNRTECAPTPEGIISYYPGEGDARDVVGNHYGIPLGGTTWSPGMVGEAFDFDGDGDWVSIPIAASVPESTNHTIEMWLKEVNNLPLTRMIYGTQDTGLYIVYSNVYWKWNGGFWAMGPKILDDSWHHLAMTYNEVTNQFIFYLDGEPTSGGFRTSTGLPTVSVTLGGDSSGLQNFTGMLDEFAIYNRNLSEKEIQIIAAMGRAGKCTLFNGDFESGDLYRWSDSAP